MFEEKGKNYWINTEWGNESFAHPGTRGMVQLAYNLVNQIIFIPEYDIAQHPFPPTLEMIAALENDPRTMHESRIYEFWHADVVFFGSETQKGLIPVTYQYKTDHYGTIEVKKLVCCLDPKTFSRYTRQLRTSQDKLFREKKSDLPYLTREDVMHIEVYRFIDETIRKNCDLLPARFKRSLEIES